MAREIFLEQYDQPHAIIAAGSKDLFPITEVGKDSQLDFGVLADGNQIGLDGGNSHVFDLRMIDEIEFARRLETRRFTRGRTGK